MSVVRQTRQREYGYNIPKDYDLAVNFVKCYAKDTFLATTLVESVDSDSNDGPPMISCRFCKVPNFENYLALANEDGLISIQDTKRKLSNSADVNYGVVTQVQGHHNAIFDLAWCPGSLQLVTVSGDHTAVLWDVGMDGPFRALCTFNGHTRSVKTVSCRPEDKSVFATGARDGKIMIWDSRTAQPGVPVVEPDNTISYCHYPDSSSKSANRKRELSRADSITSVIFKDLYSIISCSAGDGVIKVWDIRKCYSVYKRIPQPCYLMALPENSLKTGFSNLVMDSVGVRLYANCMDDTIYCYNIASYEEQPVATYRGHTNRTFYVKSCLSSDDKYLLSGSSDDNAYIWNVRKSDKPIAQIVGHRAEVTCVDWCSKGDIKLATCSDDATYRIWRLSPDSDPDIPRETEGTCLRGWVETCSSNTNDSQTDCKNTILHTTPRSLKRAISRQERTPDVNLISAENTCKRLKEDDPRMVLSTYPVNSLIRSDNKGARRLFDVDSTLGNSNLGVEILSPTSNLPNYVIDGTSPYHRCTVNRQKENQNWLTKLQQITPPPKSRVTPNNPRSTPKHKSNQNTPKTPKVCGSLLKFFRVASKQSPTQSCNTERENILAEPIATTPSTS